MSSLWKHLQRLDLMIIGSKGSMHERRVTGWLILLCVAGAGAMALTVSWETKGTNFAFGCALIVLSAVMAAVLVRGWVPPNRKWYEVPRKWNKN